MSGDYYKDWRGKAQIDYFLCRHSKNKPKFNRSNAPAWERFNKPLSLGIKNCDLTLQYTYNGRIS